MTDWNRNRRLSAMSRLGLLVGIFVFAANDTPGGETARPSSNEENKLIVHEWGTFTSFSGSNGVALDFRPLINNDLPEFVEDRQSQFGVSILSKGRIRARVRMETPVTYFYTNEELTIRASVEFPEGLLTEFYPPVARMLPPYKPALEGKVLKGSMLDWGEVHLIPTARLAPNVSDPQTRQWMAQLIEQKILPQDTQPNHYYHARETDSALVHVRHPKQNDPLMIKPQGDYIEKFLFYRGVGRFDQLLQATLSDGDLIHVTNSSRHTIRSLFRVTVSNKTLACSEIPLLKAGASATFSKVADQINLEQLQKRMAEALVRENLYPREAAAMVKTWADSWFAEEGTRIFYMVPREDTDRLLPLTISPSPAETVRVLVGRLEVMSPSVEKQLIDIVRAHAARRSELMKEDKKEGKATTVPIPGELLKLGRLAEPALVRVRELAGDDAVSREADLLLSECRVALDQSLVD